MDKKYLTEIKMNTLIGTCASQIFIESSKPFLSACESFSMNGTRRRSVKRAFLSPFLNLAGYNFSIVSWSRSTPSQLGASTYFRLVSLLPENPGENGKKALCDMFLFLPVGRGNRLKPHQRQCQYALSQGG